MAHQAIERLQRAVSRSIRRSRKSLTADRSRLASSALSTLIGHGSSTPYPIAMRKCRRGETVTPRQEGRKQGSTRISNTLIFRAGNPCAPLLRVCKAPWR
eukprot:scaffold1016_cov258-Pinguiococcus_pyrenoidosus.AAC.14